MTDERNSADMLEDLDPRELIAESYRIEGITEPECRSIFLDWVLGMRDGVDMRAAVASLLAHYADIAPDHPMTKVLRSGTEEATEARRRGGARGRQRP
ncbi:hypothetical protein [Chachezhania antarctica]|uniref:hypothetical protein n=1 Tax=Chachezhania antarctica TaxID=2340860 RepID=UPI000EAC59EE|nr:hypothetical protein [Chachezhania antarctica]|tara:strand:- start:588 stop:881 length:294 start_codon:yes stop_codon:yes gene_type:complete